MTMRPPYIMYPAMKLALPAQASVPAFMTCPAREPMLPWMTISAPRIATPGMAPALPRTTTWPLYMLSPTPQPTLLSTSKRAASVSPAQK